MTCTLRWIAFLCCLCACRAEEEGFQLQLVAVPALGSGTECPAKETYPQLTSATYRLRISFFRRSDDAIDPFSIRDYNPLCFIEVAPGIESHVQIPETTVGDQPTMVRVEAFSDDSSDSALVAVGQHEAIDPIRSDSDRTVIFLKPVNQPLCAQSSTIARAFHSATLLPNGEVIFIGGLTSDTNGSTDIKTNTPIKASSIVEILNPSTLTWTQLSGPTIPPRAFHHAVLLPTQAPSQFSLIIIGGVTPQSDENIVAISPGPPGSPFLVNPHQANPGSTLLFTYYANATSPTYEYRELKEFPATFFPAVSVKHASAVSHGIEIAVADGGSSYAPPSGATAGTFSSSGTLNTWTLLAEPGKLARTQTIATKHPRVGHGLVHLSSNRFLIVGGNLADDTSSAQTNMVESTLSETNNSFDTTLTTNLFSSTAWHTLTPLGVPDSTFTQTSVSNRILWAGGFAIQNGGARCPDLQTCSTSTPTKTPLSTKILELDASNQWSLAEGAFIDPVGYHHALRLADGSVLITGGNEPSASSSTIYSASKQVAIVTVDGNTRESPFQLQHGRFGHQVTRLLDQSILISGGIDAGNQFRILSDLENVQYRQGSVEESYPANYNSPSTMPECTVLNR